MKQELTVAAWLRIRPVMHGDEWDQYDFSANEQPGFDCPLVKLTDAQVPIDAQNSEIAALKAAAIEDEAKAASVRLELHNLRQRYEGRLAMCNSQQAEIASLKAERDGLKKDAARLAPVIAAAQEWSSERMPSDHAEGDLLKAIATMDGDWPGCEDCDHECDEPCMPATVVQMHASIDACLARLDAKKASDGRKHWGDIETALAQAAQPRCDPTLTECPRCKNDIAKCDGAFKAQAVQL